MGPVRQPRGRYKKSAGAEVVRSAGHRKRRCRCREKRWESAYGVRHPRGLRGSPSTPRNPAPKRKLQGEPSGFGRQGVPAHEATSVGGEHRRERAVSLSNGSGTRGSSGSTRTEWPRVHGRASNRRVSAGPRDEDRCRSTADVRRKGMPRNPESAGPEVADIL